MRKFKTTFAAAAMALALVSGVQAQSTINTGAPATQSDLNSLVVRQLAQAAASDINGLFAGHASASLIGCPASPSIFTDCLVVGVTPYIWYKFVGGTAGYAEVGTLNIATGVFGSVPGAPSSSARGGVFSSTAPAHEYANGVDTSGNAIYTRPAAADISGIAGTGLAIDGSGNLDLQAPTLSTLGGVLSSTAPAHEFATGINTGGTVIYTQPAVADISGAGALAGANAGTGLSIDVSHNLNLQAGTSTVIGGVEALAPIAHNFVTGIAGGVASQAQPQASDIGGLGALATANAGTGIAITSGAANLQPAQPTTIGGVESVVSAAHQWIAYIDSSGIPHQTQPQLSDIGGLTNAVTNADLAQSGAATFKGNPTGAAANATDFTIQGLTANTSPNMTLDLIPIYNHTTGTIQNVSASQLFGSVGNVTGVNGLVGSVTLADNGGAKVVSSGTTVTFGSPGGFLNKFRDGPLSIWQRGTSGLTTTTTITSNPNYTADGWIGYSFGAAATCKQAAGVPGVTAFALECDGVASNTDVRIGQRIESSDAATLAGGTDTVQFEYKQTTGSTQTPKIVGCYATATDTWRGGTNKFDCANNSDATSDLASTALTPCPSGVWCLESYTFTANANASNGYELDVDCNAAFTASLACSITALDVRATPGATVGINTNPPPPELRPLFSELQYCERYASKSYSQGTVPGTATLVGSITIEGVTSSSTPSSFLALSTRFPVVMRVAPTVVFYSPSTGGANEIDGFTTSEVATSSFIVRQIGDGGMSVQLNNLAGSNAIYYHYFASAEL